MFIQSLNVTCKRFVTLQPRFTNLQHLVVSLQLNVHVCLEGGEVMVQHDILGVQPVLHFSLVTRQLPPNLFYVLEGLLQFGLRGLPSPGTPQCLPLNIPRGAPELGHVLGETPYFLCEVLQGTVEAFQGRPELVHDPFHHVGHEVRGEGGRVGIQAIHFLLVWT